jgi:hypothetical protein
MVIMQGQNKKPNNFLQNLLVRGFIQKGAAVALEELAGVAPFEQVEQRPVVDPPAP